MNFNVLGVTKFAVSAIVGIGAGKIVGQMVKSVVRPETAFDKIAIAGATWVFGAIAAERSKEYTDTTIDNVTNGAIQVKKAIKLRRALSRVNSNKSTLKEEGLDAELLVRNKEGKWEVLEGIDPYLKPEEEEVSS
jgi:hypothetical protein